MHGRLGALLILSLALLLGTAGCDFLTGTQDAENNALLAEANARRRALDYQGAIALLDKALDADPGLARAHFELGLIDYNDVQDYPGAIYHFRKLLQLRPNWPQRDAVEAFIRASTIEIAKTAPLDPQTPRTERYISKLLSTNGVLRAENGKLRQQLQSAVVQLHQLARTNYIVMAQLRQTVIQGVKLQQALAAAETRIRDLEAHSKTANPPPTTSQVARRTPVAVTPQRQQTPSSPSSAAARTYVVRRGDNLSAIARRAGCSLSRLRAANPDLHSTIIHPGQVLNLPGP